MPDINPLTPPKTQSFSNCKSKVNCDENVENMTNDTAIYAIPKIKPLSQPWGLRVKQMSIDSNIDKHFIT